MSWGLYVFLNEIDVYLWWRCCPLYWPNGMGSSPHTLEWIDKPAQTVLNAVEVVKNGLWLHISDPRMELPLDDRKIPDLTDSYLSSRSITVISTACFSHLLFNCKRVGLLTHFSFPSPVEGRESASVCCVAGLWLISRRSELCGE